MKVQVITYGARVISISVPDRHGDIADVILGFDKVSGHITALCFSKFRLTVVFCGGLCFTLYQKFLHFFSFMKITG